MKELEFKVTIEEANKILAALGQQPFTQVNDLIGKLHHQATKQLEPKPEEKKE